MGAEISAFISGGRLGHWPYVLHKEVKFVYGDDCKIGCVVYLACGDILGGVELLEGKRGLCVRVSRVFVTELVEVYKFFLDGEE